MKIYFSNIFKFLIVFLLISCIAFVIKHGVTQSNYESSIEKLDKAISDVEKQRAILQLKEIDSRKQEINKLVTYCLSKEVTPPIMISDMKNCRTKALNYLSLPDDEKYLKKLANTPLNKDLNICTNIQSYKLK